MSFVPAIPVGGLGGWRFLEATAERQRATFEKSPTLAREVKYFEDRIATVKSAEDLVKDRRLLAVALGAFGLEAEIDKRFFLRKALESDLKDPKSMANRLTERAFRKIAEAFGFGDAAGPKTGDAKAMGEVVAAFRTRRFEAAVGGVDDSLRLALNFRREMAELAATAKDGQGWFQVLGSRPLRQVIETALGLPREFGKIDIDRQREVVRQRMGQIFGDREVGLFKDPANVEKMITRFLARAQLDGQVGMGATSPALQLLQGAAGGAEGLFAILATRR